MSFLATRSSYTSHPVGFDGVDKDFLGICVRGAALQLVTFGFYRFWLTTDTRRHLWSHTSIGDDRLEYTGRGRELLIGFLFALAILVPIYLVYFLIGIEAERAKAFASAPLFLFFIVFRQFAVYRARRYRLTRTIWRGVRFWMSGSGWVYACRWFGWSILTLLTLGLLYPWMIASLERYKMRHTFYGDLRGDFVGLPANLLKRGLRLWLLCLLPLPVMAITALIARSAAFGVIGKLLFAFSFLSFIAIPFVPPFFLALQWRWWAEGVRFGKLSLSSDLRGGSLLWLWVSFIFVALLILFLMFFLVAGLIGPALGLSLRIITVAGRPILPSAASIIVAVIAYLIALLIVGVAQRYFLMRGMWRLVATSLTVSHIEAVDGVTGRGEAANAIGEGLADSLDIAGF